MDDEDDLDFDDRTEILEKLNDIEIALGAIYSVLMIAVCVQAFQFMILVRDMMGG